MLKEDNKIALKSSLWYVISNFLLKGMAFITVPIFTRLLTQNEFGQFNNYSSWLQIMTIFVTLNVQSSLISAKYDFKENLEQYTLTMFALSALSSVIWIFVLNIFSNFFVNFMNLEIYYINCMIIYLFFYSAIVLFQLKTRLLFKYKANVILNIGNAIATSILSIILVLVMKDKLEGRILGAVIPTIIIGFSIVIHLIKQGKKINISYWRYGLKICLPYIPHTLSLVILSSMDKIMITKMCGSDKTALYGLAYNCGIVILLLLTSLNDAYAPWLGDKLDANKFKDIKNFSKKYISIFLFFAYGIMLIIPELLFILGGENYIEAKFVLAPVAMSYVFQFLYTMFVNIEQFKKKTLSMSLASASAALMNYILNIIFISKYGYVAAAYTTIISYIWLLIVHMIVVYKIGYSKIYDYKFVGIISGLSILVLIIINILYGYYIFRYIVLFTYMLFALIVFYKNKNQIIGIIKSLKEK